MSEVVTTTSDKGTNKMSYIRISNKAEGVNRLFLEKLGLSTKRDNEVTIGQFGSGSKFAPIAALRNGWEWINVGEDDLGPYKMEYVIQEEGGINCIYYKYDDEFLKPSSFVAEAGVLSWDNEFQIFREAFANALDEFTEFGHPYSIDIVDEVKAESGVFAVYITADPKLIDIITDFDKYFSIERTAIADINEGSKIFRSFDNEANFYYKGVLVYSDLSSDIPMFDYQFNHITLNEERRIRSTWDIGYKVTAMLATLDAGEMGHLEIASTFIHNANREKWEWTINSDVPKTYFPSRDYHNPNNAFKEAWQQIHGDSVAVISDLMRFKAQFALRDCKVVEIKSHYLYAILTACGVPVADDILGDEVDYEFMILSGEKRKMFEKATSIVQDYTGDYDMFVREVKIFIPQGTQDTIYGVANMTKNSVYLSINAFCNMDTLIGTMVHEYDHLKTQIGDDDNQFRIEADRHIGNLLLLLNEEKTLNQDKITERNS